MIQEIKELVEETCKKETNYFGYRAWKEHILPVVKFSKILAGKLNADKEIVEVAALLHDYSSVLNKDLYLEHHIHSAKLAEDILKKYSYSEERVERVKQCIISHRASKNIPKETVEAQIIADADSLAHFDNIGSMLYLAFVIHKMDSEKGTKWVLDKLERDWNRLTLSESKKIIEEKYKSIKVALEISGP
ncbi:HD domain-containing protein [Patescibacteria group bacterium]